MKNIFKILVILTVFSTIGYAQLNINYGIKGGLNYSSWWSGNSIWITQYAIGGSFEFQFKAVSIQPEIFYSKKGAKIDDIIYVAGIAHNVVHTKTLAYLDIPLLVKIHLPQPINGISLLIGPSLGILLSANDNIEGEGISSSIDNKNDYSNKDLGLVIGTGIDIPLEIICLTIDARYEFGIWTLDPSERKGVYNRTVSIYIGIVF
ncbi:MAG: porin family protein [Ignavibacteriales bacterium]|nr:porin family protein [Ignavibacteriales bacterium]